MPNFYLPILKGPLRGAKWNLRAGGKILRLLFSTYEPEQTELFTKIITPGDIFFDVGAHAGYYTLLASRLTGPTGAVYSFEPDERNKVSLQDHVRVNDASNVTVVTKAVAQSDGEARFKRGGGSGTGKLAHTGELVVETVSLDSYCQANDVRPDLIKMDIQGAEVMALQGAKRTLEDARPTIVISTHGPDIHRECCELLTSLEYRLEPITGESVETTKELVCYGRS